MPTVEQWFDPTGDRKIDVIKTSDDYRLVQKDVARIVEAMAGFDPLPAGTSRLPDNTKTQVAIALFSPSV